MEETSGKYAPFSEVFYYGYDGVVIGEGKNYRRYVLDGRNNPNFPGSWFYESDIYREVLETKAPYIWKGDLESREFHFYAIEKIAKHENVYFK